MPVFSFLFLHFFRACASLASQADPSTIEELYARFEAAGAKTKAEVLAALPEEMKKNYVLVSDSRSRQRGTAELPRILHFTKSAELIASSSGHKAEDDFAGNDIEVMDIDRATGKWRMAMIHFDGEKLLKPVYNHRSCLACHGAEPRPIWGDSPNWPSAYGGNPEFGVDTMGPEERASFLKFVGLARTHEGYRHLELQVSEKSFALPGTAYDLPNSVFTARLAARTAEAVAKRLSLSPEYARLRLALIASVRGLCDERDELTASVRAAYQLRTSTDSVFAEKWRSEPPQRIDTMLFRLLDADPFGDFRLDRLPRLFDPGKTEESAYTWNGGSDYLVSLVAFLILRDAAWSDPSIRGLVDAELLERVYGAAFTSSQGLRELDSRGTLQQYLLSLFPNAETNVLRATLKAPACALLTRPI